jgi:hypothetical protein
MNMSISSGGEQHFPMLTTEETMAMASPSSQYKSRIQGRKINNEPKNLLDYICTVSLKGIVFVQDWFRDHSGLSFAALSSLPPPTT